MPEEVEKDTWVPGHLGDPARDRRSPESRRGMAVLTAEELKAAEERQEALMTKAEAARKAAARKGKPKAKPEPETEPEEGKGE